MSACHPPGPVLPAWLAAILTAFLLLLARPSRGAEVAPILSMRRVSIAAGVNHRWTYNSPSQYVTGLYGAYNLTPHLSLTGSVAFLHGDGRLEQQVGVRVRIWQGSK